MHALGGDELAEFRRRHLAQQFVAGRIDLLLHLRDRQHRGHFTVQAVDHGLGRTRRSEQAVPVADLETGQHFLHRGHAGQLRRALGRDAQRLQLACADVLEAGGEIDEHHLRLAAEKVGDRLAVGLVRDLHQVGLRHDAERAARDAGGAVGVRERDLSGMGARIGDQLGHAVDRQRGIDHQHVRHAADDRHRGEVLFTVVRQLLEEVLVGDLRRVGSEQERVPVRRGPGRELGADQAGCARLVVDDDALAETLAERARDHPQDRVRGAPGRKGQDDLDRLGRIGGLGGGVAADAQHRGKGQGEGGEGSGLHGFDFLEFWVAWRAAQAAGRVFTMRSGLYVSTTSPR